MEHKTIRTNQIDLHVVQAGPDDGELVILLHGFPEFWYGWRNQIPALADAGYRVWVPDQRGYNTSAKPAGLEAYSLNELAKDVVGLIDAASASSATIVGHDWGAAVAWWTAQNYPEKTSRLVVMNVPHGHVMQKHLKSSFVQLRKSWYMFFFQLPWLPEAASRARDWKMASDALVETSRPGTFQPEELAEYKKAWSQQGAYTAMLNWYRAIIQRPPKPLKAPRIRVPTLLIWGAGDKFLGREMAQPSIELCDQGELVFIEEASHWVQHEEPERVNRLLLGFLSEKF